MPAPRHFQQPADTVFVRAACDAWMALETRSSRGFKTAARNLRKSFAVDRMRSRACEAKKFKMLRGVQFVIMPGGKSALHFGGKLYARVIHPEWFADAIQHELFVAGACSPGEQIPEQAHAEIGIFVSAPRVPRQFVAGEKLKHQLRGYNPRKDSSCRAGARFSGSRGNPERWLARCARVMTWPLAAFRRGDGSIRKHQMIQILIGKRPALWHFGAILAGTVLCSPASGADSPAAGFSITSSGQPKAEIVVEAAAAGTAARLCRPGTATIREER